MNKMAIAKLAASTLVAGVTMMSGGMAGMAQAPVKASGSGADNKAADAAKQATRALEKKRFEQAISFAEAAVELQPRNAGYRMLLGQTYLSAGRFQAAEQSFFDALTLDPERERAALNLALTQAALGKRGEARATLADYRDKLPAADFGLALALAGEPEEAVRVLEFATRAPDATAKTRQNLAFAYALAGKWNNATVMAVQDLSADAAEARLAQWAMLVRPSASYDQVAAVLGIAPGSEAGQPVRLALAPVTAPTQVAVASPSPALAPVVPVPATTVAVADVVPQPAFETAPAQVVEIAEAPEAPLLRAVPSTIRRAIVPASQIQTSRAATPRARLRQAVMVRAVTNGRYVVQLGAFSNAANAERAWSKISGKFRLRHYDPISGFTKVSNTNLVRLSISGFGTRSDASRVCARIKQDGGVCFVRTQDGDSPARWVQRPTYKMASR